MEEDTSDFVCEFCSKEFASKKRLKAHMRLHIVPRAHPCSICGQIFTDPILLQHHTLTHTGGAVHECDICQKLFSRKNTLNIHKRLHDSDKKYVCMECGKANGTKYDLECHMRIHTGEKPFQCDLCDPPVSFAVKSSLLRHQRRHTGYQPYTCATCNKTFSRKDQYKRHIGKHLEYHCQICDKHFPNYKKFMHHRNWCMIPVVFEQQEDEIFHNEDNPDTSSKEVEDSDPSQLPPSSECLSTSSSLSNFVSKSYEIKFQTDEDELIDYTLIEPQQTTNDKAIVIQVVMANTPDDIFEFSDTNEQES